MSATHCIALRRCSLSEMKDMFVELCTCGATLELPLHSLAVPSEQVSFFAIRSIRCCQLTIFKSSMPPFLTCNGTCLTMGKVLLTTPQCQFLKKKMQVTCSIRGSLRKNAATTELHSRHNLTAPYHSSMMGRGRSFGQSLKRWIQSRVRYRSSLSP